jgi:DNA-binding transcriptional regulator YhcF (GntR family)
VTDTCVKNGQNVLGAFKTIANLLPEVKMNQALEIFKHIQIHENSRTPIYRQIVDSLVQSISTGRLKMDEKIPSINNLSKELRLSRDTVEKAYKVLKERKIVSPVPGKGYYIKRTELISEISILFLISKLSTPTMQIYNSFIETIGSNSRCDIHIYHSDSSLFLKLLRNNRKAYNYYVIKPHFKSEDLQHISYTEEVADEINKIENKKLILMDSNSIGIDGSIIQIYSDFENDFCDALKEGLSKIKKYDRIILVFPEDSPYPYPKGVIHGFRKFCVKHSLDFEILDEIFDCIDLKRGSLYITIEENNLVNLLNQTREKGFIPGIEIGILSYNDTPLNKLMDISSISTDFRAMGERTAHMILRKKKGKIKIPFNFIGRNTL